MPTFIMDQSTSPTHPNEIEYYPRLKRAPYIYDGSDYPQKSSRKISTSQLPFNSVEIDVPLNDYDDTTGQLSRSNTTPNNKSSSNPPSSPMIPRRSSLLRVFSSLGMSSTAIAEEGDGMDPSETGETSTTTNPLLLLPRVPRRGSSSAEIFSKEVRDRMGSISKDSHEKYPRWALHDPSSIVMKNGFPVTVGTLLQHHLLLDKSSSAQTPLSPHCVVTPTWRLKERMKTVGVALVLALNIGTDPPGLKKPSPCAKLQCWLDPTSLSRAKAKERIGERLEQQYAKWQQRSKLKYRRAIDPTVDMVKDLCLKMRETAKNERVLFHYNGHGVPRPTSNGEIWLFDRHHTNYIPLSVTDLRRWIGKPSIVVLDCSGAGQLLPYFTTPLDGDLPPAPYHRGSSATMDNSDSFDPLEPEYQAIRDTIVLCPTSQGEWLPLNPELPADVFTSCLTTPIPISLRWFVYQNPLSMENIDLETIADAVPGKLTDRKTPLGELNWIFTAVTDTIAWNVLPSPLFQRLFRQDLLVASMFRNYLLAERILRSLNCTPMSNPEIPSTCNHPLWDAWDLAVETCLHQLIDQGYLRKSTPETPVSASSEEEGEESVNANTTHEPQPAFIAVPPADAPFFGEQLTAFEIWLEYANTKPKNKLMIRSPPSVGTPLPYLWNDPKSTKFNPHEMDPPVELPIVLQVLLSQAHRVRALVLLKRFLELGPSAVNLALSVGIFPYVLKLLQSPIDEYKHVLVAIWVRIMSFDESCRVDLVKDRALTHFIRHLNWGLDRTKSGPAPETDSQFDEDASEQRTMAIFILSVLCDSYTLGQSECIKEKLHLACGALLQSLEADDYHDRGKAERDLSPCFRTWICICMGNLTKDNVAAQSEVISSSLHERIVKRLDDNSPDVRAASCYAIACMIGSAPIQPLSEPPRPSHESSPAIQNRTSGNLSATNLLASNTVAQSFSNAHQSSFGLGLQPGMNYLASGNDQSTLFGGPMAPEIKTVYEDKLRINADSFMAVELANVLDDASPVVRFEALLALNRFIVKYIDGFVWAAGQNIGGPSQRTIMSGINHPIPVPDGMSDTENIFSDVWNKVLSCYRCEPQPLARSLLSSIVVLVNERVVSQSKLRQRQKSNRRQSLMIPSTAEEHSNDLLSSEPLAGRRNATGLNLSSFMHGSPQSFIRSGSIGMSMGTPPQGLFDLSNVATSKGQQFQTPPPMKFESGVEELHCQESILYQWKKVEFGESSVTVGKKQTLDVLSDIGAIKKYRSSRNLLVQQKGQRLKDTFGVLAHPQKQSSTIIHGATASSELDHEIDAKKEATHLKQMAMMKTSSSRGLISLLRFHPYESALVACGGSEITCWNIETSERMVSFSNDNPKNTRITSASWINENTTSLFLTGSSDGIVRVFDGMLEPNDEMSRTTPTMISSFVAARNVSVDKGATGLVLEYQSCGGQLFAGGSTKQLFCWDISYEKSYASFDTNSDAMLTTLESAWKHSYRDGYSGLSPNVVIGGFSNGSLKLYDTRAENGKPVVNFAGNIPANRRVKHSEFNEHASWIIDVSFSDFGGRNEIISGDVSGNIKYFDIRYSSSTRTLHHKMLMTALTVHSNIPMFATGSPAQFIKLVSYDGATQQVIRYHDHLPGQRVGPVSCLSFHPQMPYLAAGFSDDVVSVYAPKGFA